MLWSRNNRKEESIKDINQIIRQLSKNVYYVISGISPTGVTFYYRRDYSPTYTPSYRRCFHFESIERATYVAEALKNSNDEFIRVIDLSTLSILEIAENVIVTKTVKM